ncbi:hypothetical protein K2173_001813 [Erythroxylum novogranatense]|uniref:Saposin-like type B region 1 domain-containing protein n=1 Tax=Erythroxylum novogranatense TaxID=1862640 RepID=A0AAV8SJA7_9ROSI|nr:hypothetical protein K2173_001813 [Erythroxylum novogranatense]
MVRQRRRRIPEIWRNRRKLVKKWCLVGNFNKNVRYRDDGWENGILFIVLLGAGWGCTAIFVVYQISTERSVNHGTAGEVTKNNQVCTLCEEFATQAVDYLADNKTENEVLKILRATCSWVPTFKEKVLL